MKHSIEQMREFVKIRPWLKTACLDIVDHYMTEVEKLAPANVVEEEPEATIAQR